MPKTVMVVDDSASVRQVVAIILMSAGYNVIEASDGRDALGKLFGARVNLIICDVNMPNMDGITFIRTLETMPQHKFMPVVMLTTESHQSKKEEGRSAGVKAWMVKPFAPDKMLDVVSKLCLASLPAEGRGTGNA